MIAPRIVGIRLAASLPKPAEGGCVAVLTIEHGPWIVDGFQLMLDDRSKVFLAPPRMQRADNRIVLKGGPERAALMDEAKRLVANFLDLRSIAETPVATASETSEIVAT